MNFGIIRQFSGNFVLLRTLTSQGETRFRQLDKKFDLNKIFFYIYIFVNVFNDYVKSIVYIDRNVFDSVSWLLGMLELTKHRVVEFVK